MRILDLLGNLQFEVEVEIINNVDSILETKENVVSSDAIIIGKCNSWINMNNNIIEDKKLGGNCVDFSKFYFL